MSTNRLRKIADSAENRVNRLFRHANNIYSKIAITNVYKNYLQSSVPLTKEEKKAAHKFWEPYTKNVNTVFTAYYKENTKEFNPAFLAHDFYYRHIDPYFNDIPAAKILDNKTMYHLLFSGLKQAEEIVYHRNGFFFDGSDRLISEDKAYELISSHPLVFLKLAVDSLGGKGVVCYKQSDTSFSLQEYLHTTKTDFVAQLPLTQHKDISALHPSSINSLRIMSLLEPDGVRILCTSLRMGVKGSVVDNASSGGIFCGVDEDGKLKQYAYNGKGGRFENHPTTNITFLGYQLPSFDAAIEFVKIAHQRVPSSRIIAWDICIDEKGEPTLIEGNLCVAGLRVPQLCNGPLFGEDTKKILNQVFHITDK